MRVFICWSGDTSKQVAKALRDWLRNVIQNLELFFSDADLNKGDKWLDVLNQQLETRDTGIVCLTPDSLSAPWIHFEAGGLSKHASIASVTCYLFRLQPSDVKQPLAQFNNTLATKDDTLKMMESLNSRLEKPLPDDLLKASFERSWPELERS